MNTLVKTKEKASALIVTLLVIFLIAAFIGIAMHLTSTTVRQTESSRDFSALRSAAEGALDFAYGVWAKTTNNLYRQVSKSELDTVMATVPSFTGFSYAPSAENGPLQITPVDGYGQPSSAPVGTLVNLNNYPGWVGSNFGYLASVRLIGTFGSGRVVKYGAKRVINYSVVPLFQATAFFEGDLELYKTPTMIIGGLVHTNSWAYVSSQATGVLSVTGNLSYVKGYTDNQAPPLAYLWSGYAPNTAFPPTYPDGFDQEVHQVNRMEPLGADATSLLDTTDSNPNNDSMRELIELPNTAYPDPAPIAQRRLSNKAGILIHVTSATITITTQNGTTLTSAQKTALTNALSRQTIYDRREAKNMDLTTLDMAQARSTLNTAAGFNNILYLYDDSSTGYSDPKGIRLTNGGILPTGGLTVGSQNPVYIQGDYNTGTTNSPSLVPANATGNPTGTASPTAPGYNRVSSAVFADAVTILSNNWSDSLSAASLSSRQATNTTVNTAIVAGFLPSGWVNEFGVQYGYSGGLNNFPRFLEQWSGDTFTYYGSMIELFTSKIATGEWDTGNIYSPPHRAWNFDSNFVSTPPPGSLDAVCIGRGSLVRF